MSELPKFTVINVFPHELVSQWDYGRFCIPPANGDGYSSVSFQDQAHPDGMGVAFTRVGSGWDDERGEPKFFPRAIPALEVVTNLVREHSRVGLTQIDGDKPTEEELKDARLRLVAFYSQQVRAADQAWIRYRGQPGIITDLYREAAKHLRKIGHPLMAESRKWLELTTDTGPALQDCPVCGEQIKQGVLKCSHCNEFVDREKAIELGYLKPPTTRRGSMSPALVEGHQAEQKEAEGQGD